jgi:MFS family permease
MMSFLGPFIMDGAAFLLLTAIPLLAIRAHASTLFMGMLGWVPQICLLPACAFSGRISDKVGRIRVLVPSLLISLAACVACIRTSSPTALLIILSAFMVANGGFYPPFQASIGDRSPSGELRRNLAFFNGGLAIGASVGAVICAYLLTASRNIPFTIAAILLTILLTSTFLWLRTPSPRPNATTESIDSPLSGPGVMLPIARVAMFMLYAGYSISRFIFPILAAQIGMPEHTIGVVSGMVLVGQGVGLLLAGVGPWWKGKTWPLFAVQIAAAVTGAMVFTARSATAFGTAFLILGVCIGINYTAALYYGMQLRTALGRNTSIHESLISGGVIAGSLVGALLAQYVSIRTPYMAFSASMIVVLVLSTFMVWRNASPVIQEAPNAD